MENQGSLAVAEKELAYKPYEERLRQHLLWKIITSAILIVGLLIVLFVPIFSMDIFKLPEVAQSKLMQVSDIRETVAEVILSGKSKAVYKFSFFDGVTKLLSSISGQGDESVLLILLLFTFFLFYILFHLLAHFVFCVKGMVNLIGKNEQYMVKTYNRIQYLSDKKFVFQLRKGAFSVLFDVLLVFGCTIICSKKWFEKIADSGVYTSNYFCYITGVSGWVVLPIVVFAAAIFTHVKTEKMYKAIEADIVRENMKEQ